MTPTPSRNDQDTRGASRPDGATAGPGNDDRGNTRVQHLSVGSGNSQPAGDLEGNSTGPRLPHERDLSSDSQQDHAKHDDAKGEQAYRDATGPQQDTSLAPVTDAVYNGKVREEGEPRDGPRP